MADYIEDFDVYYDRRSGCYYCGDCDRYCTRKSDISQHLFDAPCHADDCFRCRRSFVDDTALAQHCRDSPQHWLCEGLEEDECGFDGRTYEELCQHWDESNCYKHCKTCLTPSTGWLNANNLRTHRIREHPFTCRTCGNKFVDNFELHSHKSKKHPTALAPSRPSGAAHKRYTAQFPTLPPATIFETPGPISTKPHNDAFGAQSQGSIGRTLPSIPAANAQSPGTDYNMSVNDRLSRWTEEALRVAAQNKQGRHTLFANENGSPSAPSKQAASSTHRAGSTASNSTAHTGTSKNATATSSTTSSSNNPPTAPRSFASAALKRDGLIAGTDRVKRTYGQRSSASSTTAGRTTAGQGGPDDAQRAPVRFQMLSATSGNSSQPSSRGGLSSSKYAFDDPLAVLPPRSYNSKQPQTEQQASSASGAATVGAAGQSNSNSAPLNTNQKVAEPTKTAGSSAQEHARTPSGNTATLAIRTASHSSVATVPAQPVTESGRQQPSGDQQQSRIQGSQPAPGSKKPAPPQAPTGTANPFNPPRAPRADVNQMSDRASTSQGKMPCFGSCGQWFDKISDIAKHVENGACSSKITATDIYKTAATCESRYLFIHGRYHMDMELDRDLTKKYFGNAWPFFCPKPPCEDVFRNLGELFDHIEGGECDAAQKLDEQPIRVLVDALQYRGAHGLL